MTDLTVQQSRRITLAGQTVSLRPQAVNRLALNSLGLTTTYARQVSRLTLRSLASAATVVAPRQLVGLTLRSTAEAAVAAGRRRALVMG